MNKRDRDIVTATLRLRKVNEENKGFVPDCEIVALVSFNNSLSFHDMAEIRDMIQTSSPRG